uniref:Uncharacterized protein n=1 Tax=Thermosporothrix sp. COM3 TaxID=2490863 RepID=A0A455SV98_9CHLR|nr:hypothetical protein KTC_57900 [Thermosporothrix sp. COM3]
MLALVLRDFKPTSEHSPEHNPDVIFGGTIPYANVEKCNRQKCLVEANQVFDEEPDHAMYPLNSL